MVKSVKYNEQVGTLDVEYRNGSINRYYLVTPKVFEKYFDCKSADEFVRKFIEGNFPSRPI